MVHKKPLRLLRLWATGAVLLLLHLPAQAQSVSSDTLRLPEILVSANRFDLADVNRANLVRELPVSELLPRAGSTLAHAFSRNHTSVVRSYGAGAQTLSLLGFSGSQVQVKWNGLPMNHAMLGLVDFSIIPAALFGTIRVNSSQVSAESGGHAIGGMVDILPDQQSGSYQQIGLAAGAFGSRSGDLSLQHDTGTQRLRIAATRHFSRNNYAYQDLSRAPVETVKRENAHRELNGIIANLQVTQKSAVHRTAVWFNTTDAGIPGSILAASSRAKQFDRTLRAYQRSDFKVGSSVAVGGSLFAGLHQLDYHDPSISLSSLSTSYTAGITADIRRQSSSYQLRSSGGLSWVGVTTSEYAAPQRWHGYTQWNVVWSPSARIFVYPSVRADSYSDFGNAGSGSIGATLWLQPEHVRLFGTISSNFSPPTFNDLYWPDLGNASLQPERSQRFDFGTEVIYASLRQSLYVFNNEISNGIQWLPDAGGRFRPENILKLRSRGASVHTSAEWRGPHEQRMGLEAGGTFTSATYLSQRFNGDPGVGNQLRYQPFWRAVASARYSIRAFQLMADVEYTGKRFTTESNRTSLPAYSRTDVALAWSFDFQELTAELTFTVDNVFNTDYSQIQWYPMPKRHIHAGFRLQR